MNDEDTRIAKKRRSEMYYVEQLREALEKSNKALLASLEKACRIVNGQGALKEEAVAIILEESPLRQVIAQAVRDTTKNNLIAIGATLSEKGNDELLAFYLYCFDIILPVEAVVNAISFAAEKRNTQTFLFSYLRETQQYLSAKQSEILIKNAKACGRNEEVFIKRAVLGHDFFADQDLKSVAHSFA